jgi:phage-related protein
MIEKIFSVAKTIVAVMEKIFSLRKTIVAATEKIFSVTKNMVAPAEKIFSVANTMVSVHEKIFSATETIVLSVRGLSRSLPRMQNHRAARILRWSIACPASALKAACAPH